MSVYPHISRLTATELFYFLEIVRYEHQDNYSHGVETDSGCEIWGLETLRIFSLYRILFPFHVTFLYLQFHVIGRLNKRWGHLNPPHIIYFMQSTFTSIKAFLSVLYQKPWSFKAWPKNQHKPKAEASAHETADRMD